MEALGCASHLQVELDRKSFTRVQLGETAEERDRWREESGTAFKKAAKDLCGQGALDRQRLASLKQLLIQYGAGADSTAVWQDEGQSGTIILQYAFFPGSPPPSQADVRDGIRCWNNPQDVICADRLP